MGDTTTPYLPLNTTHANPPSLNLNKKWHIDKNTSFDIGIRLQTQKSDVKMKNRHLIGTLMMNAENPLYAEQREKSGSSTFTKFYYQYNWALNQALDNLANNQEYIVFLETHEDVVFTDSHKHNGNFDFFQVKETDAFTLKKLYAIGKKEKNSILGKLILSIHNKTYENQVRSLCIVASNGFNFKNILKNNTTLSVYSIHDLNDQSINELNENLKKEIGDDIDLSKINFHHSKLSADFNGMQHQMIGKIATLIKKLFPKSYYDAEDAYRTIIDEMCRKGTNMQDYKIWDEFVANKGLKSTEIENVLKTKTSNDFENIRECFNNISNDLNINAFKKEQIKKSIQKIHTEICSYNHCYVKICEIINKHIEDKRINIYDTDIKTVISAITNSLGEKIDDISLYEMIIYCLIRRVLDEDS